MILVTQSFFRSTPSSAVIPGSRLPTGKRDDEEKITLNKENPFRLLHLIQEKTDRHERQAKKKIQEQQENQADKQREIAE